MSQAQQWYDECDAVRKCYGDDETARVHRVQCRVVLSGLDRVTMLTPWRGRPYLYKVETQFNLHRCGVVVVDSQRIRIYHDWLTQAI